MSILVIFIAVFFGIRENKFRPQFCVECISEMLFLATFNLLLKIQLGNGFSLSLRKSRVNRLRRGKCAENAI